MKSKVSAGNEGGLDIDDRDVDTSTQRSYVSCSATAGFLGFSNARSAHVIALPKAQEHSCTDTHKYMVNAHRLRNDRFVCISSVCPSTSVMWFPCACKSLRLVFFLTKPPSHAYRAAARGLIHSDLEKSSGQSSSSDMVP